MSRITTIVVVSLSSLSTKKRATTIYPAMELSKRFITNTHGINYGQFQSIRYGPLVLKIEYFDHVQCVRLEFGRGRALLDPIAMGAWPGLDGKSLCTSLI